MYCMAMPVEKSQILGKIIKMRIDCFELFFFYEKNGVVENLKEHYPKGILRDTF